MRQKRAKTYKKLMASYSMAHGFRQPYQVIIDSTFSEYAVQNHIEIAKQLGAVLQGQCKPMITQCSMVELYKLGPTKQHVVDIAKTFERRKCNHKEAIANDDCVKSVVGDSNKHRYVVASQSQELRTTLRAIPFVPLVHINRVVMVLEPPSDATLRAKALLETTAQSARAPELAAVASTSQAALQASAASGQATTEPPTKKTKKGPKGPNPLSMKKKKKQKTEDLVAVASSSNSKSNSNSKKSDAKSSSGRSGGSTLGSTDGVKGKRREGEGEVQSSEGGPAVARRVAVAEDRTPGEAVGKKRKRDGDIDVDGDGEGEGDGDGDGKEDEVPGSTSFAVDIKMADDEGNGAGESRGRRKKRRRRPGVSSKSGEGGGGDGERE